MFVAVALGFAGCTVTVGAAQDRPGRTRPGRRPPPGRPVCPAVTIAGPHVLIQRPRQCPVVVRAELAYTNAVRWRGLMHRTRLDADAGMLFLFDRSSELSFWMRDTLIPLDMIFITPQMRILGIVHDAEPRTDLSRRVPGRSQYVLEVNGGFARRHGLARGMRVTFVGAPAPDQIEPEEPPEELPEESE